ncbi:type II toxin-antitoxin system RelE/ParE family toxin [Chromatocurvus halotolerans]|uniref:Plasmid stabilization system protein ParE n=1 Tax=Chromatocurvus halotolerans TaxID=1132028 RepID=A0A4R2KZ03_9GAMM|nr:type II toxin-antitoxin system RelE/ParE family toxin [Chromatocurvus halotolerans]TCO75518.1 plasmid stabilization system protein ParE [Chromatocurvus halotolerans]
MTYSVELTASATEDLNDIVHWIARNDSTDKALHVLDQIQSRVLSLQDHTGRGAVPLELGSLGMDKYREIYFKPYRIIYHCRDERVIVNLIADGRRDMSVLLQRRLLHPG